MQIQIKNLTKNYKGSGAVLENISCCLEHGLLGVIGPNGAGKTTLLRLLAGVEEATDGEIYFDGLEFGQNKRVIHSQMGFLPQEFGFPKNIAGEEVLDYIAVLRGIHDKKRRRRMVDEAIDRVNISAVAKLPIQEYSYGIKRRLGIAQALLGEPRILILDEPLEGLDQGECVKLCALLAEMARQRLIVISTHTLSNLVSSCTTLLVLRQGNLLYSGTPSALAGLADGLVWQVEVDTQQMDELVATAHVVGLQYKEGNVVARVLAPGKPSVNAVPAKARLEEGYIALMHAWAKG